MENIILLSGKDYAADKDLIVEYVSTETVFLLNDSQTELYQYIDYLHDGHGLNTKILHKLRICRQMDFQGNVSLYTDEGKELNKPNSMKALLQQLQPGEHFRLVIENNSRTLLANIVQQLIYIDYPLTEVNVSLRREEKDAKKTNRFMRRIQALNESARSAVRGIEALCVDEMAKNASEKTKIALYENRAKALESHAKICQQIEKAQGVEMKVAVAASKKTGKSVLVNCMLGFELAPTSLELATPNNCIYKRSPDNLFHLQMLDEEGKPTSNQDFDKPERLNRQIHEQFKKAQDDVKAGFACQDMLVSYVGNGNNFESYTIYDTPGPDLAGAAHSVSALKAINECDVAIFAIDYTKYLTTTEEEFLRQVKSVFEEKQKFHTLIFVINKIDEALNDKGPKSRIKSIDFIRTRLRQIDSKYGDCIVFATSAQDYFWSVELEKAVKSVPELYHLQDPSADLYQNLRHSMDALEASGSEVYDLIDMMSNLDAEVGKLHRQLGYSTVDMQTLRLYSGIPQLMNYVSYVAKSKAREEIVNSITHTIANQCVALQAITAQVKNIEAMQNKTQEQIGRITQILGGYVAQVKDILSPDLTETDLRHLNPQKPLRGYVSRFQSKTGDKSFPVSLSKVLKEVRQDVEDLKVAEVKDKIWEHFSPAYKDRINQLVGKKVFEEKLNASPQEVQQAIQSYLEEATHGRLEREKRSIVALSQDLESVVKDRMQRIADATEDCQDRLKKNDCFLQLPNPPAFEAALPAPQINMKFAVDPSHINVAGSLKGAFKEIRFLEKFVRVLFVYSVNDVKKKEYKVTKKLTDNDMNQLKSTFGECIDKAEVFEKIQCSMNELSKNVQKTEDEVLAQFAEINDTCGTTIRTFQQGIDDRAYYEKEVADYNRMKELIIGIQSASKEFMEYWNQVVTK